MKYIGTITCNFSCLIVLCDLQWLPSPAPCWSVLVRQLRGTSPELGVVNVSSSSRATVQLTAQSEAVKQISIYLESP